MVNRRGFLGMLGAAIAGATLDPEFAVWRPGAKLISIPKPSIQPIPPNAYDLITRALRLSGALSTDQTISQDDYNFGMHKLNAMLDRWGGETHDLMTLRLACEMMPAYGLSRELRERALFPRPV